MPQVSLRSLAKINLDLRVLHKRADGYHELRTIFQTVSLADRIEIDYALSRRTHIEIESNVQITDNLIWKAAELALFAIRQRARVRFRLDKSIPMGGGLGGGSSNAAAVLLALPALAQKQVPITALLPLAAELGSDVPFFLLGGTAAGLGRGTELYPLPDFPPKPALLVTPDIHVSTSAAYQDLNRELQAFAPGTNAFQSLAWRVGEPHALEEWSAANDFETVVFGRYPKLKKIKTTLLKLGARLALMSGSGSTVFGIFDTRQARDLAAASLRTGTLGRELGKEKILSVSLVNRRQYRTLWQRQLQWLGPALRDRASQR